MLGAEGEETREEEQMRRFSHSGLSVKSNHGEGEEGKTFATQWRY